MREYTQEDGTLVREYSFEDWENGAFGFVFYSPSFDEAGNLVEFSRINESGMDYSLTGEKV